MSALGLRTLRFTNEEVLNETERVLSEIGDYLRAAQPRKTQVGWVSLKLRSLTPTLSQREREMDIESNSETRFLFTTLGLSIAIP